MPFLKPMRALGKYVLFLYSFFTSMETFKTYIKRIFEEAVLIGVSSITLVAIVSIFLGAVTTIQTADNLVSAFIPDYVISLVVRDMVILELAPTLTSIVLAGKVGSNIAGSLGTMRITEQIDALEVMGINASSYLVLPKLIASLIMFPSLVIIAGFLSLYGGYLTGTLSGILTPEDYIYGIRAEFNQSNLIMAIIKAVVFAFLVSTIAAFKGFYTRGGALEVGQSSTTAVTNCCIAILIADYLLAQLLI
mgnify:CR=1 FL=1